MVICRIIPYYTGEHYVDIIIFILMWATNGIIVSIKIILNYKKKLINV
jgi:hypothetical protein